MLVNVIASEVPQVVPGKNPEGKTPEEIKEIVRRYRAQSLVARMTGVKKQSVRLWITGERKSAKIQNCAEQLAQKLFVVDEFVQGFAKPQ